MTAKKWVTIITFAISAVALVVVLIIGSSSGGTVYDIALATFGSALLGFIMSLIEYFAERKKAMEQFWLEARIALKKLRKIQYFRCDEPVDLIIACFREDEKREIYEQHPNLQRDKGDDLFKAKNELKDWFFKNNELQSMDEITADEVWNGYYKTQMEKYKQAILDCIDIYCEAATISLGDLGNAYGNLDFLFGNLRLRKMAYNEIYNKLQQYKNQIAVEKYHFDLLQKGEGSFAVCAMKMLKLNQTFFSEVEEDKFIKVYQTPFDEVDEKLEDFRCSIYRNAKKETIQRIPVCARMIMNQNTVHSDDSSNS